MWNRLRWHPGRGGPHLCPIRSWPSSSWLQLLGRLRRRWQLGRATVKSRRPFYPVRRSVSRLARTSSGPREASSLGESRRAAKHIRQFRAVGAFRQRRFFGLNCLRRSADCVFCSRRWSGTRFRGFATMPKISPTIIKDCVYGSK